MMLGIEHIQIFDGIKLEQVFYLDDGKQGYLSVVSGREILDHSEII